MAAQPYYRPMDPCEFFANGASARPLVPGTVARGELRLDQALYRGLQPGAARVGGEVPAEPGRVASQAAAARPATTAGGPLDAQPAEERAGPAAVRPGAEVGLTVGRTDLESKPYVRAFPLPVTRETVARGRSMYTAFCAPCHGAAGDGDGVVVQRGFTAPPTYHSQRLRDAPAGYFFDVINRGYGSMPDYASQIQPRDRWAIVAYLRALQLAGPPSLQAGPSTQPEASRAAP